MAPLASSSYAYAQHKKWPRIFLEKHS